MRKIMELENTENKVVEYEIITTKKYRQVVKVQFDGNYPDELDETKITPSDLYFGEGKEMESEKTHTFTTKIVDEPIRTPLETTFHSVDDWSETKNTENGLITFTDGNKEKITWGNFVPKETKSVLEYTSCYDYGNNNEDSVLYLNCDMELVKKLWKPSKLEELSSHIISFYIDYHHYVNKTGKEKPSGLDWMKIIYKKQNKKGVNVVIYEVRKYVGMGLHPKESFDWNREKEKYFEGNEYVFHLDGKHEWNPYNE
jgi:hypothetical protein